MFTTLLFAQAGIGLGVWVLLLIGIFLLIYGIMNATNIKIVWMEQICALSALVAGAVCVIHAIMVLF